MLQRHRALGGGIIAQALRQCSQYRLRRVAANRQDERMAKRSQYCSFRRSNSANSSSEQASSPARRLLVGEACVSCARWRPAGAELRVREDQCVLLSCAGLGHLLAHGLVQPFTAAKGRARAARSATHGEMLEDRAQRNGEFLHRHGIQCVQY